MPGKNKVNLYTVKMHSKTVNKVDMVFLLAEFRIIEMEKIHEIDSHRGAP